jgi:hypothetical protein
MRPSILRGIVPSEPSPCRDEPTDTEPLPAKVMLDREGYPGEDGTRITCVNQETTDDQ